MRKALHISERDSKGPLRYERGELVICNTCGRPLYVLERGIALGDKAGRAANAFAPVTVATLQAIEDARHLDAGIRAFVRSMAPAARQVYADTIQRPTAGAAMACPFCYGAWPQVLTAEQSDTLDRAYTLELVTVRLFGSTRRVRGTVIGARAGWLHERPEEA